MIEGNHCHTKVPGPIGNQVPSHPSAVLPWWCNLSQYTDILGHIRRPAIDIVTSCP
jgi:hypothetical protein